MLDLLRQLDAQELVLVLQEVGAGANVPRGGSLNELLAAASDWAVTAEKREDLCRAAQKQLASSPRADATAARRHYLCELARCCRLLPLSDIGRDPGLTRSFSLDKVYIELDTLTPKRRAEEGAGRQAYFSEREECLSARAAATRDPMFVLLGDPGSGKSAFVKELAAAIAAAEAGGGEPVPGFGVGLVPVLMEVRTLVGPLVRADLSGLDSIARQQTLAEVVREHAVAELPHYDSAAFAAGLRQAFGDRACLLIFDGLDEVPEVQRPLIREGIAATVSRYAPPRVIITCRQRSYAGTTAFPDLPTHVLAPLRRDQIRAFSKAWYLAQAGLGNLGGADDAKQLGENLGDAATGDPTLEELASNPMLLTSMAIVHQQNRQLPRKRAEVYEQAIQVLLTNWPRAKRRGGAPVSEKLGDLLARGAQLVRAMRRLAFVAHESNEGGTPEDGDAGDLPRATAVQELEREFRDLGLAGEFLDYVDQRAGLMIGRGGGADGIPATYGFAHRTLQEYLAGCELVIREGASGIRAKMRGGDYWYLAAQFGIEHCLFIDPNGDLFVRDLPELLCPSSATRTQAQWRGQLLAAHQVVQDGADRVERAVVDRLRRRLASIMERERLPNPVERAEAGRLLGRLGDHRFDGRRWSLPDDGSLGFVEIPGGLCHFEPGGEPHTVDGFLIGKWPVTNQQYRQFVDDHGYGTAAWWQAATEAGRWSSAGYRDADSEDEIVAEPRGYGEPFCLPNHPVVGVSWYEATAYCAWLTERLGKAAELPRAVREVLAAGGEARLPLYAEAVRAAHGEARHEYPWGDEFDPDRANSSETGIRSTSAVGCFPGGCSLAFPGVEEMSGNVLEWCQDAEGKGGAHRVIRGGSWHGAARQCRFAFCLWPEPGNRSADLGFRLVLAPHSSTGRPDRSPEGKAKGRGTGGEGPPAEPRADRPGRRS